MSASELAPRPLLRLRLRGSQAEMGAQQGTLLRQAGGYEEAIRFYPTMAARMIVHGLPSPVRRVAEPALVGALSVLARYAHRHRRRRFPAYVARTEAMLTSGGVPRGLAASLLGMEVLQNTVGLLGRAGALPSARLSYAAVPACSSLAVWGKRSSDGTLRHARNFDFPGAGVWDHAPTVVFCDPDEGLRYGFVSTRGADVPGITAFNEAGLTLTVHTRFHREVRFDGAPVFDLGHEIVRTARTLADAVAVARRIGAGSTWGLLVSSAAERGACLIETTGEQVIVTDAEDSYLACTNRYAARALERGEVEPSRAMTVNSDARLARLRQIARTADAGLSAGDLELALADLLPADAHDDAPDVARLAGDCLVSPISVQSIVAEPEARRIRVSVGRAPTGFGPYLEVPFAWEGEVGAEELSAPASEPRARGRDGELLSPAARESVRQYSELARLDFAGADRRELRGRVEALVAREPGEPSFRTLAAYLALAAGELEAALAHLDAALALERRTWRRARLLLWKTRVLTALGQAADATRDELLAMSAPETVRERDAARAELKRPLSTARLRRVLVDYLVVDGNLPGAAA
jgi:tetratricopeptide (TPR) repeat protein